MSIPVFLFVCLVPAVLAKGCCLPDQWEGKIYGSGFFTIRPRLPEGEVESVSAAYDAPNKKLAVYGEAIVNGESKTFRVIEDYSESPKKLYIIEPKLKKCEISTLDKEFPELCFTESSKVLMESFVGAGEKALDVTIFETQLKRGKQDITTFTAVTTKGCVPIYADSVGKSGNTKFLENSNYVGITVGIKNSNVFDIPDYCNEITSDLTRSTFRRIPRWKSY